MDTAVTAATRNVLKYRRDQTTVEVEHGGYRYWVSVGYYRDGAPGEVFIQAKKTSTQIEGLARDAAILISLLIQHGCTMETLKAAITRDEDGSPSTLVGAVLDVVEDV